MASSGLLLAAPLLATAPALAEGTVAVRLRSGKDLGPMSLEKFIERIAKEAESRHDVTD